MSSKPDPWHGPKRAEDAFAVLSAEHAEVRRLVAALADATTTAVRQHTALLLRIAQEARACSPAADARCDDPTDFGADTAACGPPERSGRRGEPLAEPAARTASTRPRGMKDIVAVGDAERGSQ